MIIDSSGKGGFSCPLHSFNLSLKDAENIQRELYHKINLSCGMFFEKKGGIIGGADVAFIEDVTKEHVYSVKDYSCDGKADSKKKNNITFALAAVVVFDPVQGKVVETVFAKEKVNFPYIPGFLSFREGPAILSAISKLKALPDVIVYDGCGIAHPRGLGLASHISVLTGIPGIGCAKSRLCGKCDEPGEKRGEWTELILKGKVVGNCIRTKDRVKPIFVSPGSFIDLERSRKIILGLSSGKYRLPEPVRLAHNSVTLEKKRIISEERGKK